MIAFRTLPVDVTTELRERLQTNLGAAYSLERELGGGGMSRVFVAEERALGRRVVVKVLPPELAAGVNGERFRREILLAAQLQHPHIVPVLSTGEMDGIPYYTMPFVDGESLRARLVAGETFSITETVAVMRDVARALAYAHERAVVHRDIKPDNVLLSGGSAVVTDFGVAKALDSARHSSDSDPSHLTQGGISLGTPAYMAPEQAAADPMMDHRADLYSLGIVAYEMLAGRPPFYGRPAHALLLAQVSEAPVPIRELRPDTPRELANLVMALLAKNADDRPQTAHEVLRALEGVASGGEHHALSSAIMRAATLPRALAAWAVATVAVGVLARAAVIALAIPDWVFPGALLVMSLGLPVIIATALVHKNASRALTVSPPTPGGSPHVQGRMARMAVRASPHLSWRRTAMGGMAALALFAAGVLVYLAMRAFGIGPAGSLLAIGQLKNQDRLVVADFRTSGTDTALGSVIAEAVREELSQSNVVSIVPASNIAATLQRMQKPGGSWMDLGLAREVATREGAKAVVTGDLTPLGNGFVVSLRLVAAETGDEIVTFRETANSPSELIATIDELARKLRGKIGESLKSVRDAPNLEQVTTPSLAALQKYAAGTKANDLEANYARAVSLLRDAVALDTTFAMAYRKLGKAMQNAGYPQSQIWPNISKAYAYRARLTDRERYLAEAAYWEGPGGDRAKAITAYESVLAVDSTDGTAMNNLAILYSSRGDIDRSDSLARAMIRLRPDRPNPIVNLASSAIQRGRYAEADSLIRQADREVPGNPEIDWVRVQGQTLRNQWDSAETTLRRDARLDDAALRSSSLQQLAAIETVRGHLAGREQAIAQRRAVDSARGIPEPPQATAADRAVINAWFLEKPQAAADSLDAALRAHPLDAMEFSDRPYFNIALTYALAGRADRVRSLLGSFDASTRDSAMKRMQATNRHGLLSMLALAEHRPADAATEMRLSDRLPDGPVDPCTDCEDGQAAVMFDLANQQDSAIVNYEKYVHSTYPYRYFSDALLLAGSYKRLAELYDARGDRSKAAHYYAAFVDLWKTADPVLQPKVQAARKRLAELSRDLESGTR